MSDLRVIVCGGRGFRDATSAHAFLDQFHRERRIGVLIEGDARGADRIASCWARRNKITNLKFPARWSEDGLAAGPIRNERMLREGKPDVVIALPGGKGTAQMMRIARKAGVETIVADLTRRICHAMS